MKPKRTHRGSYRPAIRRAIRDKPGIGLRELSRVVGCTVSNAAWHATCLEQSGEIVRLPALHGQGILHFHNDSMRCKAAVEYAEELALHCRELKNRLNRVERSQNKILRYAHGN